MFQIGDLVVYGNNGVYQVEEIGPLKIQSKDEMRVYYTLGSIKEKKKKVYVPVDSTKSSLRNVITREETLDLLQRLPKIELLTVENEKAREQRYKDTLNTHRCEEWIRIIKTLHKRKDDRRLRGKKVTSLDARYLQIAQK